MIDTHSQKHLTLGANSRTAANTTPSLHAAILAMTPGTRLDDLVERSVLRGTAPGKAHGSTASWEGSRVIVNRVINLGFSVQLQILHNGCRCSIQRPGENEETKEIAEAEALNLPEAVAKAAILACIWLEARSDKS
jgi:hypothetical protein